MNSVLKLTCFICLVVFLAACDNKEKSVKKKEVVAKAEKKEEPLFKLIPPDQSGIKFKNLVPETKNMNILSYEYLYNGGGVAVGDVNNDGLVDLFFSGPVVGGRLYLNQGNLKFRDITNQAEISTLPFSTGVSMVDINEDGFLDIYVCRSASNDPDIRANILLINNQDLTFTDRAAEYGLNDKSYSNYASFFDYDRDGDLDLFLLNHRFDFKSSVDLRTHNYNSAKSKKFEFTSDRLYRNDGNKKFTDVTKAAGLQNSTYGLSVTASDINGDGWVDLFVANDYADKDHLYINNKNGTFTDKAEEMLFHSSKNAMGSDVADFNNDGLVDIINLDMIAEDNYRQKQLKSQTPYDLYHMMVEEGYSHQIMRNTLQLNNGDGTFSEIGQLAGISHTDWSWTPLLADFDNDGFKDLYITNGYYRDVHDLDFIKYTSNEIIQKAGGLPNVDELEMVKKMNSVPIQNYIYKNNGDLTFSDKTLNWGMNETSFSNGAVYTDLDLDGDLDIVVNNFNTQPFLYENRTNKILKENNYVSVSLKGPKDNPHGVGATIRLISGDSKQFQYSSPYRGYFSSVDPSVHFGLGKSDNAKLIVEWPDGKINKLEQVEINKKIEVAYSDAKNIKLNENEQVEELFTEVKSNFQPTFKHSENDFIDFKREPLLEHMLSNKGPFLTKGDVNGDQLEDLYIGGAHKQAGVLYIQRDNGKFVKKITSDFEKDADYEDGHSVFFDADNDGDKDLYVVSGGYEFEINSANYLDRIYINDGAGNFKRDTNRIPPIKENGLSLVAEDFDMDGDIDLFIGGNVLPGFYPKPAKSYVLINKNGVFEEDDTWLPDGGRLGNINDVVSIDIDQDKKNELVIAGEWMPITVFSIQKNKFVNETKKFGLINSSGWWNTLAFKDMDNDGDLDFIAGNRGNNSFYKASENKPAKIYAVDLDGNGSIEAIPFYYFKDGESHPKHLLDELIAQYPAARGRFPKYDDYSKSTVFDLFSDDELNKSYKLEVKTFSTSYFENTGNTSFKRIDLPVMAQISEVHGILIEDFNQDNNQDVILVGNNFGTDVEMGRSDASIGCLLVGDGKGNFNYIPNNKTGFKVIGDARGAHKVGPKDEPLILILKNNQPPSFFSFKNALKNPS
ncbi:MAG: VCBS repeat-containing protein [Vicingaceae bacterium]